MYGRIYSYTFICPYIVMLVRTNVTTDIWSDVNKYVCKRVCIDLLTYVEKRYRGLLLCPNFGKRPSASIVLSVLLSLVGIWCEMASFGAFNTPRKQRNIHTTFARSDRVYRRCQSAEQRMVNSNPSGTDFYSRTQIARCVSSYSIPFG